MLGEKSLKGYTFLRKARILENPQKKKGSFNWKNNFFKAVNEHRTINLDIGNLCTLECPKCARQGRYKDTRPVPGHNMTVHEFDKISNFFTQIHLCGQISDPIFNPNLFDFIKMSKQKDKFLQIHSAASQKPIKWYEEAFAEHGRGGWTFGIDGLPKDSHKYRIHQDGEKLFTVAQMAVRAGLKVRWQYIVFKYNENDIDEAVSMARDNGIEFELNSSSRWDGPHDPYRPTKSEYRIDRW